MSRFKFSYKIWLRPIFDQNSYIMLLYVIDRNRERIYQDISRNVFFFLLSHFFFKGWTSHVLEQSFTFPI